MCRKYIADLRESSGGYVEYEIVERIELDAWPVKEDGFRYDDDIFLDNWRRRRGWHQPDTADYEAIIAEFDLLKRVDSDQIDEVWMFGFPYAGFYESRMVGPDAFWCNAPAMRRTGVSRRFVIMGFNYERGVGPMLESFGHRVESHLEHAWRGWQGQDNLWKQFIRYEKTAPGQAGCGTVHFAPNSESDYDWGNPNKVLSNCDDWLNFPNFQRRCADGRCHRMGQRRHARPPQVVAAAPAPRQWPHAGHLQQLVVVRSRSQRRQIGNPSVRSTDGLDSTHAPPAAHHIPPNERGMGSVQPMIPRARR